MKLLVVASGFVLCLFGSTAGTQCYQCKDTTPSSRCEDIITKTCEPESSYFATISYVERNGESYVQKACVPKVQDVCKVDETVQLGPDPNGTVRSLLCCEGSLCNSSGKLNDKNILFYSILAICVLSMIDYLFN